MISYPEQFVAIICGSRHIKERERLCELSIFIKSLELDIVEVVSGGNARGGDYMGELWADNHSIDVTIMPANWDKHGKSAGPIRNRRMLNYIKNHPDKFTPIIVAIWDGVSRGTNHMINIATSAGIRVEVLNLR